MADYDMEGQLAQLRLKQAYDNQQQAQQPSQGRMAGQVYLTGNPIAQALRGYQANKDVEGATQQLQGIGQQRTDMRNKAMAEFLRTSQDQPAFEAAGPAPQGMPQEGGYTVPMQKGNLMKAFGGLANSGDPTFAQYGMKGMIEMPQIQMQEKAKADAIARQIAADAERERHNRVMEGNTIAALNARQNNANQKVDTGKTLTSGEVDKITGLDEALGTQNRLAETFKDEYAGYKSDFLGGLANTVGAKFDKGLEDQAAWWANHEANDNVARNRLFGASLTAGEKDAWDRTSIKPGMSASIAKTRMKERADLIEAQRNTRLQNLGKAGYNVKEFGTPPDTFKTKTATGGGQSPQDAAALQWAQSNPNDPRSAQILQRLGGK